MSFEAILDVLPPEARRRALVRYNLMLRVEAMVWKRGGVCTEPISEVLRKAKQQTPGAESISHAALLRYWREWTSSSQQPVPALRSAKARKSRTIDC